MATWMNIIEAHGYSNFEDWYHDYVVGFEELFRREFSECPVDRELAYDLYLELLDSE